MKKPMNNNRRGNINRNNWRNSNYSSLVDLEKEIDEYNSEILSYSPVDYSQFTINNKDEKQDENVEKLNDAVLNHEESQKINNNEIKQVNENFKFDKDLVGDIDLSDYDFDDFDDDF